MSLVASSVTEATSASITTAHVGGGWCAKTLVLHVGKRSLHSKLTCFLHRRIPLFVTIASLCIILVTHRLSRHSRACGFINHCSAKVIVSIQLRSVR
jgi:hypothetical protein